MTRVLRARAVASAIAKYAAISVLLAVAGGLVAGAGARALMRWVAVTEKDDTSFTLIGTFGILMIFVIATLPFAVAYALRRRRSRGIVGVQVAVLMLLSAGQATGLEPGEKVSALLVANRLLFIAFYLWYAVVFGRFACSAVRRARARDNGAPSPTETKNRWAVNRAT